MAKQKTTNVHKWLVVGLVVSVAINLVIAISVLYTLSTGPIALTAGNYFFAEALESDTVEVDGRTYNCMRKELSPFEQGNRLCYGAVEVDINNQEVK